MKKVHDPFDLLVDYKMFECSVCKMPLLLDRNIVYRHMFETHKIRAPKRDDPRLAKNPKLVKNECKFKCNYCPQVSDSWYSTLKHFRKNHKTLGKVPQPYDSVVDSKFQICDLCGKALLKDNHLIHNHNRSAHCEKKNDHQIKPLKEPAFAIPSIVENE